MTNEEPRPRRSHREAGVFEDDDAGPADDDDVDLGQDDLGRALRDREGRELHYRDDDDTQGEAVEAGAEPEPEAE